MNIADEKQTAIASEVKDLRRVPLAQMRTSDDNKVAGMLRRITPDAPDTRVDVAAFQSAI
ncbi:FxSxx-COOH cyclophane-containing RiPP peptide [Streptosporangium sp. NPDC000396]|uniref:FxSxx-COOH cyclophane-containing RiPP peptide n=1 Tax=Streptosporangium sp. NPDC000396 TaxID=3366185 RepID=UPI0036BDA2B7